jgi:hypothetical protein
MVISLYRLKIPIIFAVTNSAIIDDHLSNKIVGETRV